MSQYKSLFNSTRIPEIGKDRLVRFENAKHVVVMRAGHFYVFDVFDKEGMYSSFAQLVLHFTVISNFNILLKQVICYHRAIFTLV